jgi:hypothetical protein
MHLKREMGNKIAIQSNVVTPIKLLKLDQWLKDNSKEEKDFLLHGFQFGFRIPYEGKREFRFSENLLSARNNLDPLKQNISREIKAGRVAGPFDQISFNNIQISPLGLVPKKNPGDFRVIHHLSFPENASINDGIPDHLCTVQYQTVDDAIKLVKFYGKNCLMQKQILRIVSKLYPYTQMTKNF